MRAAASKKNESLFPSGESDLANPWLRGLFEVHYLLPQLEALILALPNRVCKDEIIVGAAAYLHSNIVNAQLYRHPCVVKGGARKVRAQLKRLTSRMQAVMDVLAELHLEAVEALDANAPRWGTSRREIGREATRMLAVFKLAESSVDQLAEPRRKIPDPYAEAVTRAAAVVYRGVTGRNAAKTVNPDTNKATGPFVEFLSEVFRLANVRCKPIPQINKLQKLKQESGESKSPKTALDFE